MTETSLRKTVDSVLGKMGTRPRKRLGQNFMVNPQALDRVVEAAAVTPQDTVIEVGSGLGFLTERLAAAAGRVIALEMDKWFCDHLRKQFADRPNVEVVEGDALEYAFGSAPAARAKCVGNIPYQISSPLIELLEQNRRAVPDVFITVQKDFGIRLIAGPGTRDRSALSSWLQLNAQIKILADFARDDFYPVPKVLSSLVHIRFFETPPYEPEAGEWIRRSITAGFGQKRKNVLNALSGSPINRSKPEFEAVLREAAVKPTERAEDLSGEDWIRIGTRLAAASRTC